MIIIKNLTKLYRGTNKGISNLNLHIEKGDIYAFIGHNGAGKTTTLKALAGIHDFDSGEVLVDGLNIKEYPVEYKKEIAYVPDNPNIYEYLTANEYLNFVADIYNVNLSDRCERVNEYAQKFKMLNNLDDLISNYSHGMKQKLILIAAMIHRPKVLILDEPFVGLDPQAIFELKEIMRKICEDGGAVLFSTHVLEVAKKLCNKVAIIKNGHLIVDGEMEEVLKDVSLEELFMEAITNA